MDYIKLRNIVENNKISITDLCKKIPISRKTFYNNLENKTLKVETLEKICTIIRVPVTTFFLENNGHVADPATQYGQQETISDLRQQCIEYRATIKTLTEIINEQKQQRKK